MKTAKAVYSFLEAKHTLSKRTIGQYTEALDFLKGELPKLPRKPEQVRRALNKASTVWTQDTYWRVWCSFFGWCSTEYRIADVMDLVERPKTPVVEIRYLEPSQLTRVVAAAESDRDQAIVALALDAGVRASEFGNLHVSDLEDDTIRVWGKGKKLARVPLGPEAVQILRNYILTLRKVTPQTLLFTGKNGQPMDRFYVYHIVRKCMDRAGIAGPKRGPHCLRHSLATNYIDDGGDPFSLKRVMRHNNLSTTQKYVNLKMNSVVRMHNEHSPFKRALLSAKAFLTNRDVEHEVDTILKGKKE
jgi:site-specific recombinase XerD